MQATDIFIALIPCYVHGCMQEHGTLVLPTSDTSTGVSETWPLGCKIGTRAGITAFRVRTTECFRIITTIPDRY